MIMDVAPSPAFQGATALPGGGGGAYPNPEDDDGGWGPIGPWVHKGIDRLADMFAHRLANEIAASSRAGGGSFYPAPDDDGDWGPLGPVVKDVGSLYLTLKQDTLREIVADQSDPDPTPWTVAQLREHIHQKLVEWLRDPDPEPWRDTGQLVEIVVGGRGRGLRLSKLG